MKTEYGDNIYHGKDGRLRVYVYDTGKTISYPKYLMEKELGRKLSPNELVHHKDENPLNNKIDNLEIKSRSKHSADHMQKYFDTTAICGWCGKEFNWSALQQQRFYSERRTGRHTSNTPFCSRECSGKYARHFQENNPAASKRRLTDEQVRYIRDNYVPYDKNFGLRSLAKKFNVDSSVISLILRGKTYKDIL